MPIVESTQAPATCMPDQTHDVVRLCTRAAICVRATSECRLSVTVLLGVSVPIGSVSVSLTYWTGAHCGLCSRTHTVRRGVRVVMDRLEVRAGRRHVVRDGLYFFQNLDI